MPYRRWWEQPDTTTLTPPDPGVAQPEPMPFWETEDAANAFPPTITDNIPSLETQGEPIPAGGPVSSPPGPPAPPPVEPTPALEEIAGFTLNEPEPIPPRTPGEGYQGPQPGEPEPTTTPFRERLGRGLTERLLQPSPLLPNQFEPPRSVTQPVFGEPEKRPSPLDSVAFTSYVDPETLRTSPYQDYISGLPDDVRAEVEPLLRRAAVVAHHPPNYHDITISDLARAQETLYTMPQPTLIGALGRIYSFYRGFPESLAGLITLGVRLIDDPTDPLLDEAIQSIPEGANPLTALAHLGDYGYNKASLPFLTGLADVVIDPTNRIPIERALAPVVSPIAGLISKYGKPTDIIGGLLAHVAEKAPLIGPARKVFADEAGALRFGRAAPGPEDEVLGEMLSDLLHGRAKLTNDLPVPENLRTPRDMTYPYDATARALNGLREGGRIDLEEGGVSSTKARFAVIRRKDGFEFIDSDGQHLLSFDNAEDAARYAEQVGGFTSRQVDPTELVRELASARKSGELHYRMVNPDGSIGEIAPWDEFARKTFQTSKDLERVLDQYTTVNPHASFPVDRETRSAYALSQDFLQKEAVELPKTYAAREAEAVPPALAELELSTSSSNPLARVGDSLYDVTTNVDPKRIAVFRSPEDYAAFKAPDGTTYTPDYLRKQNWEAVYIPQSATSEGRLVLLDPAKAAFRNPRTVLETDIADGRARDEAIRKLKEKIDSGAGVPPEPPLGGVGEEGLPPSPGSAARARVQEMFERTDATPPSRLAQLRDLLLTPEGRQRLGYGAQRQLTDDLVASNDAATQAKKLWEKDNPGAPFPLSLETEKLNALGRAHGSATLSRMEVLQAALNKTLDTKNWPDAINSLREYLHYQHVLDIAKLYPGRVYPGNLTEADARAALQDMVNTLGDAKWDQLQKAAARAIQESRNNQEMLVREGFRQRGLADYLDSVFPNYIRQDIVREDGTAYKMVGRRVPDDLLRKLTEEGTPEDRYNPIASLYKSISTVERQTAANKSIRAMGENEIALGRGTVVDDALFKANPNKPIISYFTPANPGELKRVLVPDYIANDARRAIEGGFSDTPGWVAVLSSLARPMRSIYTTYSPSFVVSNPLRDYMATILAAGTMPRETVEGFRRAIDQVFSGGDPVIQGLLTHNAGMGGIFGKTPTELEQKLGQVVAQAEEGIVGPTELMLQGNWKKGGLSSVVAPFSVIRRLNLVAELGNRAALGLQSLRRQGISIEGMGQDTRILLDKAKDLDEAFYNAAFASRRGTLDFLRMGEASREINKVHLFFSPQLQGQLLPWRSFRDDPASRLRMGVFLTGMAGLTQYNMSYSEYDDVPAFIKMNKIIVMLPSKDVDPITGRPRPNYISVIPNLSEWAPFVNATRYAMEALNKRDHEGFAKFLGEEALLASPFGNITALIPTGFYQLFMYDIPNNYDYFRGRDIVPPNLINQEPEKQYLPSTNPIWKDLGQLLHMSPLMLEHVALGIGASPLRALLSLGHFVVTAAGLNKLDEKTAQLLRDLQATSGNQEARRAYLTSLASEDRQSVLNAEAQARYQPGLPFLSEFTRPVYSPQGGGRRELGQEKAQEATGLSAKQTQQLGGLLGKRMDSLGDQQQQDDARFDGPLANSATGISGREWRDRYHAHGQSIRDFFDTTALSLPKAAQVQDDPRKWLEWQTILIHYAGYEEDPVEQGRILSAAYQAIPVPRDMADSPMMDEFFRKRKEFRDTLTPSELSNMDSWIRSGRSKTVNDYQTALDKLEPYFGIREKVAEKDPKYQGVDFAKRMVVPNDDIDKSINENPDWKDYQSTISAEKERLRRQNPELDALLVKYQFVNNSIKEQDRKDVEAKQKVVDKETVDLVRAKEDFDRNQTVTTAVAVANARDNLEIAKDALDRARRTVDDPTVALTPPPRKGPKPGQFPNEDMIKHTLAATVYEAPQFYGPPLGDPRIKREIDDFYKHLDLEAEKTIKTAGFTYARLLPDQDRSPALVQALRDIIMEKALLQKKLAGGWRNPPKTVAPRTPTPTKEEVETGLVPGAPYYKEAGGQQ